MLKYAKTDMKTLLPNDISLGGCWPHAEKKSIFKQISHKLPWG